MGGAMRARIVALILLVSAFTVHAEPVFQKGMSYTPWGKNSLQAASSDLSIVNMSQTGVQWIALTVFWFQDGRASTEISEDFNYYSASKPSLVHAIERIHAAGMKVMLKPHVDMRTGEWRARIQPSAAWFNAYEQYIVNWAKFATENRVDMLCVGCEFVDAAESRQHETEWRRITASVRGVFQGPLTYASNHGSEQSVLWWDALDYIGIDAYYSLTAKANPTLNELLSVWKSRANLIESWRNRNWSNMPIIFTEIGYRSYDGANAEPWDYTKDDPAKVDLQEQVDCYNAALQVLTPRDWFFGFYWWQWDTQADSGGETHTGYTVQNKPAQILLADWYLNKLTGGRFTLSNVRDFVLFR
jgi:hypothetical protein